MKVFNTLSRKEEVFDAVAPVKMYVCGVTPYDDCHLGHAMSYTVFDTVRRYLEYRGYQVRHVQNFTDVDDKIIDRAAHKGISIAELTAHYISRYFEDMDALNIQRAQVYPRATEEIPKMQEVIQVLIQKGHAYPVEGSVYFRVGRFHNYGRLSGRDISQMEPAGPPEPGKESPHDFALWKASKPGEPSWESPWGNGRPGWHIECTAMAIKYLGASLDIHGGGRDLIFPHHENEIAQSESFTGIQPFARYWMHNGMVQVGEQKMSKSLGNLVTVRGLLERYSPDAIRLLVLGTHYRNPLTYTDAAVESAEKGVERLRLTAQRIGGYGSELDAVPYRQDFIEAMDADFNTPQAIAVLFELAREINKASEDNHSTSQAQVMLKTMAGVLGLTLKEREEPIDILRLTELVTSLSTRLDAANQEELSREIKAASGNGAGETVNRLVEARRKLRSVKQWQLADAIRSGLTEIGISLEDTPQGTIWRRKKQI
ncbi:MAG: cysteine--tRNA ligase [Chloroflexi bacterium]|nr:cysteine--tRNA ligase [Chloroflexota bacterium]